MNPSRERRGMTVKGSQDEINAYNPGLGMPSYWQ